MKRNLFAVLGLVLVLGIWLTGCSKDNGPSGPSLTPDQQAIQSVIASEPLLTSDATFLNDGDVVLKIDTAIYPRNWGRKIDLASVTRNVSYQTVDDSTVLATITTSFSGTFWIRATYNPRPDSVKSTFLKPFTENIVRKVIFRRVNNPNFPNIKWRIIAVSAVKGGTVTNNITITNVTFYIGDDTLKITDPNAYFMRLGVPIRDGGLPELTALSFTKGFKVEVTVVSSAPDSDIVTAHRPYYFLGGWRYRAPMRLVSSVDNGNGTYTRVYEHGWLGVWQGRHHMFVSAVTRESLFDNVAPFSSQVWGIPYIVN